MKIWLILAMALIAALAFFFWYLRAGTREIGRQTTDDRLKAAGKVMDLEEKIRRYTSLIESDPKSTEAYCNRGNVYCQRGDYDKAVADYTKAIELNPQLAMAYYNRGHAYHRKGNYDKAIADCTKAIELNPQLAEAYNNRGNA